MKKSLAILALFLLSQAVCSGIALVASNASRLNAGAAGDVLPIDPVAFGVAVLFGNLVLVLLLWSLRLIRRNPFAGSPGGVASQACAVAGMMVLAFGLSFLAAPLELSDGGSTDLFRAMTRNPLCLLSLCVVGPLTEELVFREGVMRGLMERGFRPVAAVAVSALAFGLVHGNAAQALPAGVLGCVLGLFYLRTGNVRLCGAAHVVNNTFSVVLLSFPSVEAFGDDFPLTVRLALGAALAVAGGALLLVWWKKAAALQTEET